MKASNASNFIVTTQTNSITLQNYRYPILSCSITNSLLTFLYQRKGIMISFASFMDGLSGKVYKEQLVPKDILVIQRGKRNAL